MEGRGVCAADWDAGAKLVRAGRISASALGARLVLLARVRCPSTSASGTGRQLMHLNRFNARHGRSEHDKGSERPGTFGPAGNHELQRTRWEMDIPHDGATEQVNGCARGAVGSRAPIMTWSACSPVPAPSRPMLRARAEGCRRELERRANRLLAEASTGMLSSISSRTRPGM